MTTAAWSPSGPLDLRQSLDRYTRWGEDLLNVVVDGVLCRVSEHGAPYRISQPDATTIEVTSEGDIETAVSESKHRLSEHLDIGAVRALGRRVSAIGDQLSRTPGYRPPMSGAVLESLVASISAQQVNLQWAATTRNRLVERYGTRHRYHGVDVWEFPAADTLASADPAELRSLQFTTRKSEYIVGTAQAVATGALDGLAEEDDTTVIERITAIRGLGRWTAEWFLARSLGRPHAIAAGDLGVRKAVSKFANPDGEEMLSEPEVRSLTVDWGDGGNWGVHLLLERLASV